MWRFPFALALAGLLAACGAGAGGQHRASDATTGLEVPSGAYTGSFLLLRDPAEIVEAYLAAFARDHVRGSLAYLVARHVDIIPNTETPHTVVFILDQDVSDGTRIRTTHQFQRYQSGNLVSLDPYEFDYRVDAASYPLIILNESQAGGANGYLIYRLYVDGVLAAIKRVEIVVRLG